MKKKNNFRLAGISPKAWLLCLFLSIPLLCDARTGQLNTNIIPPSPTSAVFGRVASQAPSLLTGSAELSIPLFRLECHGLEIPFSLRYSSNGIKVDDDPAPCGYGWALHPGLRITRTILGRPDEQYAFRTAAGPADYDNFAYCKKAVKIDQASIPNATLVDTQHDVFTLSLGSQQCAFALNRTASGGFEAVTWGSTLKIEVAAQTKSNFPNLYFTVTDDNGVKYYFGDYVEGLQTYRYVTAWMLHRVELPNGESITFTWKDSSHFSNFGYRFGASTLVDYVSLDRMPEDTRCPQYTESADVATFEQFGRYDKLQHLTKVTFPGGHVDLTYKTGRSPYLTRFMVKNRDELTVCDATLAYGTQAADSCLLRSVTMLDGGVYRFTYDPHRFTSRNAQDYWGYYNGKTQNTSLIPHIKLKEYHGSGEVINASPLRGHADRGIDAACMKANLLTRVDYPTGGYACYEYEPHRFTGKRPQNQEILSEYNQPLNQGGGLRVTRIVSKADASSEEQVRTYKYGEGENGLANSLAEPTLESFLDVYTTFLYDKEYFLRQARLVFIKATSGYMDYEQNALPIWYSEVTEYAGGGKTVYKFKNWTGNNQITRSFGVQYLQTYNTLFSKGPLLHERTDYKRENGTYAPVRKTTYTYTVRQGTNLPNRLVRRKVFNTLPCSSAAPDFDLVGEGTAGQDTRVLCTCCTYGRSTDGLALAEVYSGNMYYSTLKTEQLTSVATTTYTPAGERTERVEYGYEDFRKTKETVYDGGGNELRSESYLYPADFARETNAAHRTVLQAMASRNMNARPFRVTLESAGAVQVTELTFKAFGTGGLYLPEKETLSRNGAAGVCVRSYDYDAKGNLCGIVHGGILKECYLWGYDGRHPVAHIRGLNYTEAKNLAGTLNLAKLDGASSGIPAALSSIRTSIGGNGEVTTYTYLPLVGTASVTLPGGNKTSYTYDSACRLSTIKNVDGKTTHSYSYHYKPAN